jgi:cytochrome P450
MTDPEAIAVELFRTAEGRTDPYPRYHALRVLAPVHRSETARAWLLTRYEDCHGVLRDPRFVRDYARMMDWRRPTWRSRPALRRGERAMLNIDGPEHTRLRKAVARSFTPRTIERLRPRIEASVDALLDRLEDGGGGDLIADVAFPLPVTVIGDLLGVPEADRVQFRDRMIAFTAIFELGATREMLDAADEASDANDDYFASLLDRKRADPEDDLVSALVSTGDELTGQEITSLATMLFGAGFETTTNLIGNGMIALLEHPAQLDVLRSDPSLFANLADELLRYDGTVQMVARTAAEPVEIGGSTVGPGESAFMLLGAANRDPARYPEPDRLDLRRTNIQPLSFGSGVHFCLGASLARAEIEIVFRKLVGRFGTIELAGNAPVRDRLALRGRPRVPLALLAGRPQAAVCPVLGTRASGAGEAAWRAAYRERLEASPRPSDAEIAPRVELLTRIPLFRGCTVAELRDLVATAYPLAFDPGDVLCVEGADPGDCYVIAEGEATVTAGGRLPATVGADDVVGERGPLSGQPRAATVTASTHMLTFAISRERLMALVAHSAVAAEAMRAELARRYSEVALAGVRC